MNFVVIYNKYFPSSPIPGFSFGRRPFFSAMFCIAPGIKWNGKETKTHTYTYIHTHMCREGGRDEKVWWLFLVVPLIISGMNYSSEVEGNL